MYNCSAVLYYETQMAYMDILLPESIFSKSDQFNFLCKCNIQPLSLMGRMFYVDLNITINDFCINKYISV